jgi:hypothetical protein
MEPIYDREGRVVAWQRGSYVYHLNGSHAGVIYGTYLYSRRGQHLGVFRDGLIWDCRGGVVAFVSGASGGLELPALSVPPVPPVPSAPPVPAVPSVPHVTTVLSPGWGQQEWEQFINA